MQKLESNWKTMWEKEPGTDPHNEEEEAVQKYVNLVDLVKSFPTSIYLQNRRRYSR